MLDFKMRPGRGVGRDRVELEAWGYERGWREQMFTRKKERWDGVGGLLHLFRIWPGLGQGQTCGAWRRGDRWFLRLRFGVSEYWGRNRDHSWMRGDNSKGLSSESWPHGLSSPDRHLGGPAVPPLLSGTIHSLCFLCSSELRQLTLSSLIWEPRGCPFQGMLAEVDGKLENPRNGRTETV